MGDYERWHDGLLAWEADDGNIIYSASAMGSCTAELVHSRRGIQAASPPDWLSKAFEDGKREEQRIIDQFCKEYGIGVTHKPTQWHKTLEPFVGRNILINCHLDEMAITGEIVEVKLLAASTLKDFLKPGNQLYEHYMWQLCPYSKAWGEKDIYFVLGEKNPDGSFRRIADVQVLSWEEDLSKYWPKIKAKILKVEKMVANMEEPTCEMPGKFPCFYNFMYPDNVRKVEAKKQKQAERVEITDEEVGEWVQLRHAFHEQSKVAEQSKREYDLLIKEKLGDTAVTKRYTTAAENGVRYNFTQVPFPKTMDWDKLKKLVSDSGMKWDEFLMDNEGSYFKTSVVAGDKTEGDDAEEA